jgi:hypothetical protein
MLANVVSEALPNALDFSRGAAIDREGWRVKISFQKRYDLTGVERRPLQVIGRRQPFNGIVDGYSLLMERSPRLPVRSLSSISQV